MKTRFTIGLILCVGSVVSLGGLRPARAQFAELVRRVPSTANTIVLVDAEKVFASPAAIRDNWRENRQRAWEAGLSLLPPTANHAVLASQLDLKSMINVWETAIMELDHDPALDKLMKLSGGSMDKINGYSAVAMRSDSYVVDFKNRIVGAMAPGNRQLVGRWVQESESRKSALSPYLAEAYAFANDLGTPVVMALDLEYVVTVDDARVALSDLPDSLGVEGINLDQLSELMASIRGVTLGITLRDKPFGKVKVDFAKEFPLPAPIAKGLLLHALAKRGAMIDEFEDWAPAVSGKQFTLEGTLEQSGIRRLSSLFDRPPAIPDPAMQLKPAPEQSPGDPMSVKDVTKKYWTDMTRLLSDLSERKSSPGTKTMGQVGVFCERYAAKIEKLPTLNVDPELLDFSSRLCSTLRQIHSRIHAGARQGSSAARAVTPTYNYYGYGETYGYTYGWPVGSYGYVAVPDMRAYYNEQARVKYEANSQATFDVRQVGKQIQGDVAAMRRKLTDKYQTQF